MEKEKRQDLIKRKNERKEEEGKKYLSQTKYITEKKIIIIGRKLNNKNEQEGREGINREKRRE